MGIYQFGSDGRCLYRFGNLGDEWYSSAEPPCVVYGEIMVQC